MGDRDDRIMPRELEGVEQPPEVSRKVRHRRVEPTVAELVDGVLMSDRRLLAMAISLVESSAPRHRAPARELLRELMPHSGQALRLGISGVPGVGKSTLIDVLGRHAIEANNSRVAVLAVDPSSEKTGGSILGDKTRMGALAASDAAFIRPSPSGAVPGGVARATREAAILCDAAGYDLIIIETVGVGQGEVEVASMSDIFLVLLLTGAGDELQGIKRGILELADVAAITKADGDNTDRARAARSQLSSALRLLRGESTPPVRLCSAITGDGVPELWHTLEMLYRQRRQSGELEARRRAQAVQWMQDGIMTLLRDQLHQRPEIASRISQLREAVMEGLVAPFEAAESIVSGLLNPVSTKSDLQKGDEK